MEVYWLKNVNPFQVTEDIVVMFVERFPALWVNEIEGPGMLAPKVHPRPKARMRLEDFENELQAAAALAGKPMVTIYELEKGKLSPSQWEVCIKKQACREVTGTVEVEEGRQRKRKIGNVGHQFCPSPGRGDGSNPQHEEDKNYVAARYDLVDREKRIAIYEFLEFIEKITAKANHQGYLPIQLPKDLRKKVAEPSKRGKGSNKYKNTQEQIKTLTSANQVMAKKLATLQGKKGGRGASKGAEEAKKELSQAMAIVEERESEVKKLKASLDEAEKRYSKAIADLGLEQEAHRQTKAEKMKVDAKSEIEISKLETELKCAQGQITFFEKQATAAFTRPPLPPGGDCASIVGQGRSASQDRP